MPQSSSLLCDGVYSSLDKLWQVDDPMSLGSEEWCDNSTMECLRSASDTACVHALAMARQPLIGLDGMQMASLFDHQEHDADEEENNDGNDCNKIPLLDDKDDSIMKDRYPFLVFSTDDHSSINGSNSNVEGGCNNCIVAVATEEDNEDDSQDHGHESLLTWNRSVSGSDVVLQENLMESLQEHLPLCKRGESFWLKYSLLRDGASLDILLDRVQDSEHTILAIETLEGEVFGAFCSKPWKLSNDFYGSGQSFLWRVRQNTDSHCTDDFLIEGGKSSEVQVFKFAFCNHNIQLCQPDRMIVGGGGEGEAEHPPTSLATADSCSSSSTWSEEPPMVSQSTISNTISEWGFGLWLEHDLLRGSSSPCVTFQSPSLSRIHADGSLFQIRNLEVWSLTPCCSVVQALHNQRQRRLWSGASLYNWHAATTTVSSTTCESLSHPTRSSHSS